MRNITVEFTVDWPEYDGVADEILIDDILEGIDVSVEYKIIEK